MKDCWKAYPLTSHASVEMQGTVGYANELEFLEVLPKNAMHLQGTVGYANELEFVEVLLKNAMHLQRLKTVLSLESPPLMKDIFHKKLLTFFHINSLIAIFRKESYRERLLGLSLNCMPHHLTSVKLQHFSGCYTELKFVKFLLKNAMSLQELMICFATIKNPKNNVESRVVKVSEEEVL